MKVIQKISTSITAHISALVDQIENHEAVANVALADIRDSLMQAKYQIRRVQNELRCFEQRLKELEQDEKRWSERAVHSQGDHERALECVRRLKRTRDDIQTLNKQMIEHEALERQLTADVRKIETNFEELKRKRSVLTARESRAQALTAVGENCATDVGGVFDRWEQKIMRSEVYHDDALPSDSFAEKFNDEEERKELEQMLSDLTKREE